MVAVGTPADLTLFTEFGVMPVSGHWQMRHRVDQYLEQRAQEVDSTEPDVHVLTPDRAVEEWKRLEPEAIGHERPRCTSSSAAPATASRPSTRSPARRRRSAG